ncbi:protein of unknown function [Modicisalibacter muralis]|uniref:DUF4124 domain-containing protein n=1 Tax=Modicisalibacter muralis TaxID=119000 RepID=A0A1G9KGV5_9GAMM|nr:DUF4124 domain-containing protein [Halomonas muralis]SDL48812.1 protein of unknown function [Halomonas muralis]
MPIRSMCLMLGLCLPLAGLQAASVYRSVDAQGNVIFTDKPIENSERIELEPLTVVPSPEPLSSIPADSDEAADDAASGDSAGAVSGPFMPYSTFRIVSPQDEQTLPTGVAGNVQVELEIDPDLRDDHRVRLLLDGEISQSAMHTKAFMLTNLDRGEHRLRAELLDASGNVRHRSAPITLYVQRASVNLPANPNNPAGLPPSRTDN